MFPKWYTKWNEDNRRDPDEILGPAILIGVAGGALLLAAVIITWGNPAQTSTVQTGPRGIHRRSIGAPRRRAFGQGHLRQCSGARRSDGRQL